jgi:hypothetical protein
VFLEVSVADALGFETDLEILGEERFGCNRSRRPHVHAG